MNETSKTKKLCWTGKELHLLLGKGIDIGCGSDPVQLNAKRFDINDGDANKITQYVFEEFDYVFSSHCLEHMYNPYKTILDWWKLVKTGGYLFVIIPDEDLYEQGVFPSRFNSDHKHTFTISKNCSWSNVSVNILDLINTIPNSEIVNIELQNNNYDYILYSHGPRRYNLIFNLFYKFIVKIFGNRAYHLVEKYFIRYKAVDQTKYDNVVAQIQFIIKKVN